MTETATAPHPDDPPDRIDGRAAWYGQDLAQDESRWLTRLSQDDIAELETAADAFLSAGHGVDAISPDTFPLPRLGDRLRRLRESLIDGIGFELIRGLPVDRYDAAQIATIYCGLGCHVGSLRSQNAAGHVLGHVRDTGADVRDFATRIYQTRERQTFHTDSSDAVSLLCLKQAAEGGESLLASSVTIYNEMRAARPDLATLLFEPIATDRRGEVPPGEMPYFMIPAFNWHAGRLTSIYQRQYIDSAQRFDDAPRLSAEMIAALDMHDELANDPRLHLSMHLRPGDLQFVYNHTLLHDRMGFRDHADPDKRRHMLRLWLSLPEDRPLPPVFAQRYVSIAIGDRGGIVLEGTRLNVPLW